MMGIYDSFEPFHLTPEYDNNIYTIDPLPTGSGTLESEKNFYTIHRFMIDDFTLTLMNVVARNDSVVLPFGATGSIDSLANDSFS